MENTRKNMAEKVTKISVTVTWKIQEKKSFFSAIWQKKGQKLKILNSKFNLIYLLFRYLINRFDFGIFLSFFILT